MAVLSLTLAHLGAFSININMAIPVNITKRVRIKYHHGCILAKSNGSRRLHLMADHYQETQNE
jgi:hypothetical protein